MTIGLVTDKTFCFQVRGAQHLVHRSSRAMDLAQDDPIDQNIWQQGTSGSSMWLDPASLRPLLYSGIKFMLGWARLLSAACLNQGQRALPLLLPLPSLHVRIRTGPFPAPGRQIRVGLCTLLWPEQAPAMPVPRTRLNPLTGSSPWTDLALSIKPEEQKYWAPLL